jgi:hypothetical protein
MPAAIVIADIVPLNESGATRTTDGIVAIAGVSPDDVPL